MPKMVFLGKIVNVVYTPGTVSSSPQVKSGSNHFGRWSSSFKMIKCLFLLSFFFVIWTVQCHEVEEDDDGGLWIYEEDFLDQPRRTKVNGRQNFDGNHLNKTTNRPIFGNPNATSMADSAASTELVIEDDTTTSSFASFNVSDHIEVNETIHAGLWGQYIKLYPYLIIPA